MMFENRNKTSLHANYPAEDNGLRVTASGAHINAKREQWLCQIAELLLPVFEKHGFDKHPVVRIGVGFPTTGARGKAIGQCHDARASRDHVHEIIISPKLDESEEVAGVLAHEFCHAYLQSSFPDENCGHGKKFKKLALGIGLTGPMRSTVPDEAFKRFLQPVLATIGDYPHGALGKALPVIIGGPKPQPARLKKVCCRSCSYTMRVTQKWIDTAIPKCPSPDCEMHGEEMEVA
jgi:hypothetical protein